MTDTSDPRDTAPDTAARDALEARAYDAFDHGQLKQASALFGELTTLAPEVPYLHYMRGLAHKYLRDWPAALQHALRAQALHGSADDASAWNAGIAATALGDWAEARRQWTRCGIGLPRATVRSNTISVWSPSVSIPGAMVKRCLHGASTWCARDC